MYGYGANDTIGVEEHETPDPRNEIPKLLELPIEHWKYVSSRTRIEETEGSAGVSYTLKYVEGDAGPTIFASRNRETGKLIGQAEMYFNGYWASGFEVNEFLQEIESRMHFVTQLAKTPEEGGLRLPRRPEVIEA